MKKNNFLYKAKDYYKEISIVTTLFLLISSSFIIGSSLLKFSVFLLLIVFLITLSISSIKHCFRTYQLNKIDLFLTVTLLVIGLCTRIYRITDKSLWLDESTAIAEIFGYYYHKLPFTQIVDIAAIDQQPPLDYFFEAMGLLLFGESVLGARIHAAVFGTLTIVVVYLLLKLLTKSQFFSFLGSMLAILHPLLIYYSQEGRPYATAVFFMVLYLFSIFNYFLKSQKKQDLHLIFSTQTLLLFVVGLQPPILIFVLTILSLILFKHSLHLLFIAICSGIIYLPYFVNIVKHSLSYFYQDTITIQFSLKNLKNYFFDYYPHILEYTMINYQWWFFVFSAVALILIGIDWLKRKKIAKKDKVFILINLSLFLFICIIIFAFHFAIDWLLQERYTIFLVPLFILSLILSLQRIVNCTPFEKLISKRKYRNFLSLLFLSFPIWLNIQHLPNFYGHLNSVISHRPNWKKIYQYIKEESTAKDVAMAFSLEGTIKDWGYSGLLLHRVYLHSEKERKGSAYIYDEYDSTNFEKDLQNLISKRKNVENIFISLFYTGENERARLIKRLESSGLLVGFIEASALITLKIRVLNNDVARTMNILLKDIEYVVINLNTDSYLLGLSIIYRSLCYLGIELNDSNQVDRCTKNLKSKKFEGFFVEEITYFEHFLNKKL